MGENERKEDIPEIEVTPAMVEAGKARLDYLLDGAIEGESGLMCIPSGWAEEVYRAMETARPRSVSRPR